jgi:serralysin
MGATGSTPQGATGIQDIDGVLSGVKWNSNDILFNFPTSAAYYPEDYNGDNNEPAGFHAASAALKSQVRSALNQFAAVSNLTFTEVNASAASNISVAKTDNLGTFDGYGYYPGNSARAGDIWFSTAPAWFLDAETRGHATWYIVMHEVGHAVGLKHGHETGGPANVAVTAEHDYFDYTIMTYRHRPGGPLHDDPAEAFGWPQSLMMLDIAALQTMYGANYNTNNTNTTYTWSPTTGEMSINGAGQGAPGANRIYMTLWDGGGVDTYDLSNYTTDLSLDLNAGGKSIFSSAQLALLSTSANFYATGNVFNALMFNNDQRSLIENARGGSGDDEIVGNQKSNKLVGNGGNDTLSGGTGNDWLLGGAGNDTLSGAAGNDTMQGGSGNDVYYAGAGDAIIEAAGQGTDKIVAAISYMLPDHVEKLQLSGSVDVDGTGNALANTITGNSGNNELNGGAGNDTLVGGLGGDALNGGADFDTASYASSNAGVNVNLATGVSNGGHAAGDTFSGIEKVIGSAFVDRFTGDAQANSFSGGGNNDALDGLAGNDWLAGGAARDRFVFDNGYDVDTVADYQAGLDRFDLTGVSGLDTYQDVRDLMSQSGANVVIDFGGGDKLKILNTTIATLDAHQGDFLV